MKPRHDEFDPGTRIVPTEWMRAPSASASRMVESPEPYTHEPYKWMTTLAAPLAETRRCALQAFAEANATLAYLYENDEKVVIRCTLLDRQIRAELKPVDARSTRIVMVTMRDSEFDRRTSGQLVDTIEQKLQEAGFPLHA